MKIRPADASGRHFALSSRWSRFVFKDIFAENGIERSVLSSDGYGQVAPPGGPWWRDQRTIETVWGGCGKILFWELTPFLEWKEN